MACGNSFAKALAELTCPSLGNRLGVFLWPTSWLADESGASFWAPGTFANLAAVLAEPGWSFSATYFHATLMGAATLTCRDVRLKSAFGGLSRRVLCPTDFAL